MFETDKSMLIAKGDTDVIKTGDDDSHHYLLKLTKDPHETEHTVCDGCNHKFPPYQWTKEGNYLDLHKEQKNNDVYCVHGSNLGKESRFTKKNGGKQLFCIFCNAKFLHFFRINNMHLYNIQWLIKLFSDVKCLQVYHFIDKNNQLNISRGK